LDANAAPHQSNRVKIHEQAVGDIWQKLTTKGRSIAISIVRMAQGFDMSADGNLLLPHISKNRLNKK
jgi:hypothetical protein